MKTAAEFNFETPTSVGAAPNGTVVDTATGTADNFYMVTVKAEDPSGASEEQDVVIEVENVNEAPAFTAGDDVITTLWITEGSDTVIRTTKADPGDATADLLPAAYTATDNDGALDAAVAYSLEGADIKYFNIGPNNGDGTTSVLTLDTDQNNDGTNDYVADYEEKSSYSITIVATTQGATGNEDRGKMRTSVDVTVNVVDAEDDGTAMLSQRVPQVGRAVTATLDDPDGGVTSTTWQWWRSNTGTDLDEDNLPTGAALYCTNPNGTTNTSASLANCAIRGATSSTYTPGAGDVTTAEDGTVTRHWLTARVEYSDNITDNTDSAVVEAEAATQVSAADNTAPSFPDQDPNTVGDQTESTTRDVAENTKKGTDFGDPVEASDADATSNGDLVLHTLGGADADSFGIDRTNGQLKTKAALDYETKATYMVVVTATDPSGATDTINVTINVTDVNDDPAISLNQPPAFDAESADRSVDENSEAGTAVGDPVAATDPNEGQALTYALSGDDAMSFAIDGMGQITVAEGTMLDYEAEKNTYVVTVTATDTVGEMASITVNIAVADVKENNAPAFDSESMTLTVPENSAGVNIGDPVAATDPDEGDELEYSITDESGNFAIDSATGQVSVIEGAMLDHEAQASYMVVVMATDGEDSASVNVTISVTNVGLDNPYDTDDSGSISKAEAVNAVQDYFDDALSRDGVLEVIRIYFG